MNDDWIYSVLKCLMKWIIRIIIKIAAGVLYTVFAVKALLNTLLDTLLFCYIVLFASISKTAWLGAYWPTAVCCHLRLLLFWMSCLAELNNLYIDATPILVDFFKHVLHVYSGSAILFPRKPPVITSEIVLYLENNKVIKTRHEWAHIPPLGGCDG